MSAHSTSFIEVLSRLVVLHDKLEAEGRYVSANTAWMAIEEIKRLVAVNEAASAALKKIVLNWDGEPEDMDEACEAIARARDAAESKRQWDEAITANREEHEA